VFERIGHWNGEKGSLLDTIWSWIEIDWENRFGDEMEEVVEKEFKDLWKKYPDP
jgi:hypothetical protein